MKSPTNIVYFMSKLELSPTIGGFYICIQVTNKDLVGIVKRPRIKSVLNVWKKKELIILLSYGRFNLRNIKIKLETSANVCGCD